MDVNYITESRIFERDTVESYGKLNSEYNARARVISFLLNYIDGSSDSRLETHPLQYEKLFEQILKVRPHIYYNDNRKDNSAMTNLKHVIKSYDDLYATLLKDLAKQKYLYAPDCVIALDKFSNEINNFPITHAIHGDVANAIRKMRAKYDDIKLSFGKMYASCWNGHISYSDALAIAKHMDRTNHFINMFDLQQSICWFKKVQELLKNKSQEVLKEQKHVKNKRTEKNESRKYIDSQIEIYQLNQELAHMRKMQMQCKTK